MSVCVLTGGAVAPGAAPRVASAHARPRLPRRVARDARRVPGPHDDRGSWVRLEVRAPERCENKKHELSIQNKGNLCAPKVGILFLV